MAIWFEGEQEIACDLSRVETATDDLAAYFLGVVRHMPGLNRVELLEQGEGFVHIETNEGLMKRTGLTRSVAEGRIVVEFDEVYEAGSKITVTSHYVDTFEAADGGVTIHTRIDGVEAPGFLGFFYRNLGSASIGKAVLQAHRGHLEGPAAVG